jgi:hypothetical protein
MNREHFSGIRVGAAAAALAVAGVGIFAANGTPATADETVSCDELPQPWTAAHEIIYEADRHIVVFVWEDNTHAAVSDTEPGCAGQPGLEQELQGNREGALVNERAACRELRELVDAVRSERRSQGKSMGGTAEVSEAAERAAARRAGTPADAAVAKRRSLPDRTIDLDQADSVLEQCPR